MFLKFRQTIVLLLTVVLVSGFVSCKQEGSVRFAFLTDLHVVPGNDNEHVLDLVVEEINKGDFDFVVITGDLTNMGSDEELHAVKDGVDGLTIPYYILPGNHETNWSETGGATYKKLFGADRFYFEHNGYGFVGFNAGPYMKMGDGHVKSEDLKWLQSELPEAKDIKLISMAHYPIADGLDNWPEVSEVLKAKGVSLALCGHGHRLRLMNFNGITGLMGRALIGKNKEDVGYTIVTLNGDQVFVEEKKCGQAAQLYRDWNLCGVSQIDTLPVSVMPSMQINEKYPNVAAQIIVNDDASVMGGFAMDGTIISWLSSDGYLKAFDAETNTVLWQEFLSTPQYATPTIYKNSVIVGTSLGDLKAFDLTSGTMKWETNVGYPVFAEGVIDNGSLYIACGKGGFTKIDPQNGRVIWTYNNIGGFVQAKPCITDKELIFGAWDKYLYCLDKATGSLNWKWTNGHGAILYSPGNVVPAVANNKVFIVAPDRYFTVLDLNDGSEIYRTKSHQVRESMCISGDKKHIYAKLMNDSIVAFPTHGKTHQSLWTANVGFGYEHNPCPLVEVNGVVYGGTRSGEVFAVDAKTQTTLWRHKISNSSVNKLFWNDGLWFNTMDGKIAKMKVQ
ncbi:MULTISPECIES: PQQ-binding-like beta-propeller repeat protein [unclassified Carboxylicivirga]|uniref:outer membrane protein assembly factor BamB family protein n=1 Tax=Carboxylicivirga TaxID=1628153 RepID=UPI003D33AF6F